MISLKGGGFSGLEDVSSDDEDDSYKEDLTDDDSNSTETTTTRRPHKKKARGTYHYHVHDNSDRLQLSVLDCDVNIPSLICNR